MFSLDEIFAYSKKKILEVEQNLDVIYGAHSEEKKNGLNQLHGLLKLRITKFFEDVISESQRDKNNIINDIDELLIEKQVLEKVLQLQIGIDDNSYTNSLIDFQIGIDNALQKYRKIKQERLIEFHKLQEEEKQICQLLGKIPKYSEVIDMPSAAQLETIKHRVVGLKNVQIKRRAKFMEKKAQVESLIVPLGEIQFLQFDKIVLDDPNKFQLSGSNFDELQKLVKYLEDQTENQKRMTLELKTKLSTLWERLQIDITYRAHFMCTKKGYSKTVIHDLKMEIERCETLKKENIKQFIEKLRDELKDLWDKCHFGEEQRNQCRIYYNTEFNEDVMNLLSIEVDNATKFYNDNISIYHLIEDREQLWNKMIMLQERVNDPVRLTKNRGGQLLKEEKERKVIQKELPRVERELENLLGIYEQREGKLFMFEGESLLDIIDRQWNANRSNRKNIQQTKEHVRNLKTHTLVYFRKCITRTKYYYTKTLIKGYIFLYRPPFQTLLLALCTVFRQENTIAYNAENDN